MTEYRLKTIKRQVAFDLQQQEGNGRQYEDEVGNLTNVKHTQQEGKDNNIEIAITEYLHTDLTQR